MFLHVDSQEVVLLPSYSEAEAASKAQAVACSEVWLLLQKAKNSSDFNGAAALDSATEAVCQMFKEAFGYELDDPKACWKIVNLDWFAQGNGAALTMQIGSALFRWVLSHPENATDELLHMIRTRTTWLVLWQHRLIFPNR